MPEYVSTRDPQAAPHTFSEVVLDGLAADGGLYVPTSHARLDYQDLRGLLGIEYIDLFTDIFGTFVGDDIAQSTQADLARQAYHSNKFPNAQHGNIAPLTEVGADFYVQDLSGGPTAAFKDMAMQPLGGYTSYLLEQLDREILIVGATTGDTGPAAEAAFKGMARTKLIMLSPQEGMSDFQKAQMGELSGGNIVNLAVDGTFDDCQDLVKLIKEDPELGKLVGNVNSINWARIAAQVPYYFSGYLQAVGKNVGQEVDFVVPTGNFGNILAGYMAREMGLPIRRLIAAANENDVVHSLIQTGEYVRPDQKYETSSPSMDITVASNFERLLYDLLDKDPVKTAAFMRSFKQTRVAKLSDFGVSASALRDVQFDSGRSTHQDRLGSIIWANQNKPGFTIDPHTADAVTIGRAKREKGVPIVCLSTAKPVKFEPTLQEALGYTPVREERFVRVGQDPNNGFIRVSTDPETLKQRIHNLVS